MYRRTALSSFSLFLAILSVGLCLSAHAQEKAHLKLDSPFGSYIESEFPFHTQALDARGFGEHPQKNNLTPRGIIVPVGTDADGLFACFDPDLLRWSLFWKGNEEGEYLSMVGMASGSYRQPARKAPPGQANLPKPYGTPWLALPLSPGVAVGEERLLTDPRDRGHAEEGEVGLGALPKLLGRFSGIRLVDGGAQIEYRVGSSTIRERLSLIDNAIVRLIQADPRSQKIQLRYGPGEGDWLILPPSKTATTHQISISPEGKVITTHGGNFPSPSQPAKRWKESVHTEAATPPAVDSLWVFDDYPMPMPNPWKRNVRFADLDFFPDGRAAFVTFDGDIWIAKGLDGTAGVDWTRFASGLDEPQNLAIRDERIYVFDRNGIVCLHDTDGNGEADWYENVSNVFAQSAETRQYAMDFIALPDGGFYVALGGQIGTTIGKLNGTVIKIAPDGDSYEVIATGFRQPYLGYDPVSKILTASDQQGNWKPATPIYRVEPGRYFGFMPEKYKGDVPQPHSIDPAAVWIPHFINQSGAGQVWIRSTGKSPARMGELNDSLVHIGYGRPEIFRIYLDPSEKQGAVVPLLAGFPSGLLNGRVSPVDGYLYLTGFQIFGSAGARISGVYRAHPGKRATWLPSEVLAEKRGLLLRFDKALTPDLAGDLGRFSADRWNYIQTFKYGSGNYKLNGEPGQDALPVLSAKLSQDAKSIFLGIADMQPSHSLHLTYRVPAPDVETVSNVYLTVHELPTFDLKKLGFSDDKVDLTPRTDITSAPEAVTPTAELGKETAIRYGCIACHATEDPDIPTPTAPATEGGGAALTVGPPWMGLFGAERNFTDGTVMIKVDDAYIRESILDPSRRVPEGYEMERTGVGMPSYLGVLKDYEIESLILYIKSRPKK